MNFRDAVCNGTASSSVSFHFIYERKRFRAEKSMKTVPSSRVAQNAHTCNNTHNLTWQHSKPQSVKSPTVRAVMCACMCFNSVLLLPVGLFSDTKTCLTGFTANSSSRANKTQMTNATIFTYWISIYINETYLESLKCKKKGYMVKDRRFSACGFRMVSCQIKSNKVWLKSADNKP